MNLQECYERSLLAFEITIPSLVLFSLSTMFLIDYAFEDLRNRRVSNNLMIASGFFGFVATIITGHLLDNLVLHISAFVFTTLVALLLFRIGAIGGADFKALMVIAITSPGILFSSWPEPLYEGIIASGLEIAIMLLLGIVYSKMKKRTNTGEEDRIVPLLPLLLLAYMAVQCLALI